MNTDVLPLCIVSCLFEEFYNQGNLAVADELFASNAVRYDPATPDVARGPESARQVASSTADRFRIFNSLSRTLLLRG